MARMLKLAVAPSGAIVYRATGKLYRGETTVKGNRVYGKTGRLIGYTGKPTKTQNKAIERLDRNRQSAQRRARLDQTLKTLEMLYNTPQGAGVYTRRQLTNMNYAHYLNSLVNAGKMTQREARNRFEKYINLESSTDRTAEWNELKDQFPEMGFPYT